MPARVRFPVLPVLLAATFAGCGESPKSAEAPANADTRFVLRVGAQNLRTRVMLTDLELETGLMTTPTLPADEGMLFAYRDADRRAFWMKNVPYDIDIGFFDASGALRQIERLKANDLTPVQTHSDAIRYALEAPAGWYVAHGLASGAKLDLPALADAVRRRGFDAKAFVGEK